jgi:hypothetical protein
VGQRAEELADVDTSSGSLALTAVGAIADRMDEIRDRVQASEVTFTVRRRQLCVDRVHLLQAEHPPRDGNLLDRIKGFNVETFYPALIRKTCVHRLQRRRRPRGDDRGRVGHPAREPATDSPRQPEPESGQQAHRWR